MIRRAFNHERSTNHHRIIIFKHQNPGGVTPASLLTADLRVEIVANRAELLALLSANDAALIEGVVCYTPSGNPMVVQARDADHAEWLKRMNPAPIIERGEGIAIIPGQDQQYCRQCTNFSYRGVVVGPWGYGGYCHKLREQQIDDVPRRCKDFVNNGMPEPLSRDDDQRIRTWLTEIGETDAELIAETLERCNLDREARQYYLARATHD
jgi:hypothetical protein